MPAHTASCLCGGVRMHVSEIRGRRVLCHCRSCRKSSGSAYGANVSVPADGFGVVAGDALLRSYESSPGKHRFFCSVCGSQLFARSARWPGLVRLRLGALDTPYAEPHAGHGFVADKAAWDVIHDGATQYPGRVPEDRSDTAPPSVDCTTCPPKRPAAG